MIIRYPYRAVICGEEDFITGWREGNLLTRKRQFVVRLLHRDLPIQSARILEVAKVQFDERGDWLINARKLPPPESGRGGFRFAALDDDEDVRVYKEQIRGVVWIQTADDGRITAQLDRARDFWKKAEEPARPFINENVAIFKEFSGTLSSIALDLSRFKEWSSPIWLTEFSQVGAAITEQTPEQIKLAKANAESGQKDLEIRRLKAAAKDNLKEALSKWMRFEPIGMKVNTKARIEKAVKMYLTDSDKRSLAKIAADFGVSRTTVWKWFQEFTQETGFPVITHQRHESVADHLRTDSETAGED